MKYFRLSRKLERELLKCGSAENAEDIIRPVIRQLETDEFICELDDRLLQLSFHGLARMRRLGEIDPDYGSAAHPEASTPGEAWDVRHELTLIVAEFECGVCVHTGRRLNLNDDNLVVRLGGILVKDLAEREAEIELELSEIDAKLLAIH